MKRPFPFHGVPPSKLLLSAVLLFITAMVARAQETDFQSWYSFTLKKPLGSRWQAALQEELRLKENSTRLRSSFTDLSVEYDVTSRFDVSAAYRFIIRPDEVSQRIYSDLAYEAGMDPWSLKFRLRLQHEFIPAGFDETYLRPKVTAGNKVSKRWEPFVSGELFYHIFFYEGNEVDEIRVSGGTTYFFNRQHSISGYYLYERELNRNQMQSNHVAGISYDWKLH